MFPVALTLLKPKKRIQLCAQLTWIASLYLHTSKHLLTRYLDTQKPYQKHLPWEVFWCPGYVCTYIYVFLYVPWNSDREPLGVSKNNGTPNHKFDRIFHHEPSILGLPLFLETPICCKNVTPRASTIQINIFGMFLRLDGPASARRSRKVSFTWNTEWFHTFKMMRIVSKRQNWSTWKSEGKQNKAGITYCLFLCIYICTFILYWDVPPASKSMNISLSGTETTFTLVNCKRLESQSSYNIMNKSNDLHTNKHKQVDSRNPQTSLFFHSHFHLHFFCNDQLSDSENNNINLCPFPPSPKTHGNSAWHWKAIHNWMIY